MNIGLVCPSFPGEKRVALLPDDIVSFPDHLIVEEGFGLTMGIRDEEYVAKGCTIWPRSKIFLECDGIFSLKLLQPKDYHLIRDNQMIIGWVHPSGSGCDFMINQALKKKLKICDLDNAFPNAYYRGVKKTIDFLPKNFLSKNSFYAGIASTMHAFMSYGVYPDLTQKIAVLGNGNTSQGAFHFLSKFTDNIRMYYRKTIDEFKDSISSFDVIVNGIEIDSPGAHIITEAEIVKTKENCFFIDAAADAGNAIEGTKYTNIENPLYKKDGRWFYVVNNSPSIIYRTSSRFLSEAFSKFVFLGGIDRFSRLFD